MGVGEGVASAAKANGENNSATKTNIVNRENALSEMLFSCMITINARSLLKTPLPAERSAVQTLFLYS